MAQTSTSLIGAPEDQDVDVDDASTVEPEPGSSGLPPGVRQRDAEGTAALVAVQRLQAAYADAVTRRAWDDLHGLFEPDVVVRIDTRTRPPFSLDGSGALVAFIEQSLRDFAFFEMAVLNSVVDVTGDHGTGRMYISELRHHRDGTWSVAHGLYQDRYARRDGAWRIADRRYASLARRGEVTESFPLPPIAP